MVSSPEPLIPSSVSSPTTISSDGDNSIFVQIGHPMTTRAKSGISKLCLYIVSTISTTVPKSLQQVIQTPHWFQTMTEEYNVLIHNNTWDLVTPPSVSHLLDVNGSSKQSIMQMEVFNDIKQDW